ncbi:Ser-Thr-rich glycosyl-phosphatidyl-inositol-anchored membrane family-domain-containing protein [Stachybotrys elegans]|uniref:Ser-Thr-rich glycosyl-phosphatidyl-inositol-anchored membrane family-domain-containing protein n=1 Tax=Stachybotrys elegans TaxID=80388 RepID=A0A8K0WWQ7_9HYPO|nr:Ser-Thr-rich glycosyl-phosphatidyl-inositol-anchored membrane family-domain-containing protein [Stachybotrys elegans]
MSVSAFLAMAASVLAQTADFNPVYTPLENEVIPAGTTYEVTWDAPAAYADGTITITLIGGATQGSQVPIQQIAAGIPNSQEKFSWTVEPSLGAAAVYGLKFSLDSNPDVFQYSMPFSIDASGAAEGTSTSASASAAATVTSAYGIKTVTLSEAPEPTTTEATTTVVTTSAAPTTTSTFSSTTVRANTTTLVTSTSASASSSSSSSIVTIPSSSSSLSPSVTEDVTAPAETTPGSGAASLSTSFFAVAGLVMAYMAL